MKKPQDKKVASDGTVIHISIEKEAFDQFEHLSAIYPMTKQAFYRYALGIGLEIIQKDPRWMERLKKENATLTERKQNRSRPRGTHSSGK